MHQLRHDVAWAATLTILESLPPSAFVHEARASVAFHLYRSIVDTLEAYDAQLGQHQHQQMEPSPN